MTRMLLQVGAVALLALWLASTTFANAPITHPPFELHQVYPITADFPPVRFVGFSGPQPATDSAIPGFFDIEPGIDWSNYVTAALEGITYTIKNITLEKRTPQLTQCASMFPARVLAQSGTINIRLRWPLMYEPAGTVWTLTVTYGTSDSVYLPGEPPGTTSYVHQDVWYWTVVTSIDDMQRLLVLFRQVPFGTDEVPLISDEALYVALQAKLDSVEAALAIGDIAGAAAVMTDFELEVMDACITESPGEPNPTGPGTGIANSEENPACCKLLADAESLIVHAPPAIGVADISATPAFLWPADGRLAAVYINYSTDGDGVRAKIASVKCNEAIKEPDWRGLNGDYRIYDAHKVYLRASRTDKWKDRIYTITVIVTDAAGKSASGEVQVRVPRILTGL